MLSKSLEEQLFGHLSAPESLIEEKDTGYQITMDIPGVRREDLTIEVQNQTMTVAGERKGVRSRSFEKKFKLSDEIATEDIKASLVDGVLTLNLNKTEKVKAKKILIT
jgi:HSP20 family protein